MQRCFSCFEAIACSYVQREGTRLIDVSAGCVGVLAVFSIGDMVVYNRRKRAIYFAEQEREQAKILEAARTAVATGTASAAQTALVAGIAEEEEAMERKKAERKAPSKLLWWLHGDWKEEKLLEEQRKAALAEFKKTEAEGQSEGVNAGVASVTAAVQEARDKVADKVSSTLSTSAATAPVVGGPLDQEAAKATQKVEQTGKGWLGWMWGSSKKE